MRDAGPLRTIEELKKWEHAKVHWVLSASKGPVCVFMRDNVFVIICGKV